MNLEAVEQRVASFLQQVSNPLVRIDVLLAHLHDDDATRAVTTAELKDFLVNHDLFSIVEPFDLETDAHTAEDTGQAAPLSGPYVLLSTRVPSGQQLAVMMLEQLNTLHEALVHAQAQARDRGDIQYMNKMSATLDRIGKLKEKLVTMHRHS